MKTKPNQKKLLAKTKNNMFQRAITGTFYVAAIVTSVYFGGWYLHILFGIVSLLMLQEFAVMFKKSEYSPNTILGPIVGFLIYITGVYYLTGTSAESEVPTWVPLVIVSIISFTWMAIAELFRNKKNPFANLAITFSSIIYIILPLILINFMSIQEQAQESIFPLLGIFIMIWCSDTFAYLVGRKIGKNKMFERISPNKSWEGFFGGMTFAMIAGLVIAYFLEDQPFIQYAIMGMLAAIFGTLGDLVESLLKRSLNLKDSGKILPGHGGLLDRLDSVLVVIPVIFVFQLITFYYFG
jgi:phosphatidate cytidylyltransferase